eukprot:4469531-Lingulodinium_polyedra.AAC.1
MPGQPEGHIEDLPLTSPGVASQCAPNLVAADKQGVQVAPVLDMTDTAPCPRSRAEEDARPPGL